MATVYVWRADQVRWGHATLKLKNGTYISWWPRGGAKPGGIRIDQVWNGVPSQKSINNAEDVDLEGRNADAVIQLPDVLDEGKIRTWYQGFGGNYHLATRNCATVVYLALSEGGSNSYVDSNTRRWAQSFGAWDPEEIEKYARAIKPRRQ